MKALLLFFLFSASTHASEVPAYSVRIGLEPASKIPRWLVELVPPPEHHFNLSAPMKVQSKAVVFRAELKEARILGFAASSLDLTENDSLSTSAFLCDDAKTYCVKKTVLVPLKVDPTLQTFQKQKRVDPQRQKSLKDKFGFWVQDPESAVRESLRTGKLILIDFFGVWCPPCNLYEELVFLKPGFQKLARRFVLLRMDADQESSFELKSKLKVGGYPTLILAKLKEQGSGTASDSIVELGRVVGFLPEQELIARLSEISKFRTESLEDRIHRQKQELLAGLRLHISQELDSRNGEGARKSLNQALALAPESTELKVLGILVRALDSVSFQWRDRKSVV